MAFVVWVSFVQTIVARRIIQKDGHRGKRNERRG
jgi:hypothetical protein